MITIYFETPCCDPIPIMIRRVNFDDLPNKMRPTDASYVSTDSMHKSELTGAKKERSTASTYIRNLPFPTRSKLPEANENFRKPI